MTVGLITPVEIQRPNLQIISIQLRTNPLSGEITRVATNRPQEEIAHYMYDLI
jgi:hypothetical protein